MKAHRSLKRTDVLRHSPDKIALMVASEFLRASSRAQYPQTVQGCFERAKELMGILETIPLDPVVAGELSGRYRECSRAGFMVADSNQSPEAVKTFSEQLASAFERASQQLKEIPHA